MTYWNPEAWQRHLELVRGAHRYCSNSWNDFRLYWLSDCIMILNQQTGECRKTTLSEEEESKLLFGNRLEQALYNAVWDRGERA